MARSREASRQVRARLLLGRRSLGLIGGECSRLLRHRWIEGRYAGGCGMSGERWLRFDSCRMGAVDV